MLEAGEDQFLVRIYLPDDQLLAQSIEPAPAAKALEFVQKVVKREGCSIHFHWECRPAEHSLPLAAATT